MNETQDLQLQYDFLDARRKLFEAYYADLNPAQREALFAVKGPLLVVAGAGSGKTTVLANRIAHIIRFGDTYADTAVPFGITREDVNALRAAVNGEREEQLRLLQSFSGDGCPPWAILSITFTNKAAKEMTERLEKTVGTLPDGSSAADIWSGTFHSVCLRMLRRYAEEAGLRPGFTIYDTDDCKRLVNAVMKDLNIDEKMLAPKAALSLISRAKDQLQTPEDMEAGAKTDFRLNVAARVWRACAARMEEANVVDFDDIIVRTVRLLSRCEDARSFYQHRFRYVCVDEYQDTNRAQYELIKLLSGFHRNLMAVGDDDQSIYKFRGACIENILNFEKDMPDARIVKLEQNYRSTQCILDAANGIISHNAGRRKKTLFTQNGEGDRVVVHPCENQNEEGRYIAHMISQLSRREGRPFSDFAVLYRTNAQSNAIEQVFARSGIPYRVLGGMRFYERKEIKDILSYLCLIVNPTDDLRLKRVVNEPKRKLGDTTVAAVEALARTEGVSMAEIMRNADSYVALRTAAARLREFVELIGDLRAVSQETSISETIRQTIDRTGYRHMLEVGGEEGRDRLQNCEELISNAVEYEQSNPQATLQSFLEEVALISDIDRYDSDGNAAVLMTVHSAKGLEFPVVFLPGWEENLFPGMQSALDPADLEEERRLAYVAVTRARQRLVITHCRERLLYGRTQYNHPSRFLAEMPEGSVKQETPPPPDPNEQPFGFRRPRTPVAPQSKSSLERFAPGDSVYHASFGRGDILSATDLGSDILYEIAFDRVGTKKLMATYARLTRED